MKRAKTKFAKRPLKYEEGGPTPADAGGFLNETMKKTNAQGIGSALDALGATFGAGGNKGIDNSHTNPWSIDAAENYNRAIAKNQRTKKQVSSGLSTAGDIAMLVPGVGTAIGVGLKALGAAANFIPFGKGKEKQAKQNFERMNDFGNMYQQQTQGVMSFNRMPKYKAPAYGRKGLKFKTKFSKK